MILEVVTLKNLLCCLVPSVCPTLCDAVDCSPPGSSVHGILQPRILEWDAIPSSRGSSRPRSQTCISCGSCTEVDSLPLSHQGRPRCHAAAKSLQLYLALCDAMDCSPPGSSVHGILQARILEWGAMPFSKGSS